MTIDLSESDAQRKGFINSVYAATYGNAIAAAILYFDPAIADYHNQERWTDQGRRAARLGRQL
jgi:trimethylamine:corrinoid methyltransferase-like protein